MSYENYWIVTCGFCCIYPVIIHLLILWITKQSKRIDWNNVNFKFWKKEQ